MDEEDRHGFRFNPILVGLFGVIAGAVMVATYHLVYSVCNCYRRQMLDTANTSQNIQHNQQERPSDRSRSTSTPRLIPIFRYSKDCNEEMCAVCLSDLKEGEQIRVLLGCLHFFHVACIDRWLNLHLIARCVVLKLLRLQSRWPCLCRILPEHHLWNLIDCRILGCNFQNDERDGFTVKLS
ncbi:hypothetical protein CRYUN_Cryun08bG0152700 [Craigia yunnanensis]